MYITSRRGFSLVELMIVVAVIGLISAIGIPAVLYAGNKAKGRKFAREIKTAGNAFVMYAFDNGNYPPDVIQGQLPAGMGSYLSRFPWTETTVIGGSWDWDYRQYGVLAGISVYQPSWKEEDMADIDSILDDGNLGTGQFRRHTGGYIYILEEN
ncbi:MAG: prepilin-type N-terminal cleavage/methylation domain-containing protein [Pontiellaceae bacterium]|nr:prepilin-type N-terminal cleavage/methylation domain-containing protein [Pontiellaceae bacterium]MBN2785983.1 prepilin-type N-terminal cleavage/methylation domain-containing protein [Pontiellaceae bacterium]